MSLGRKRARRIDSRIRVFAVVCFAALTTAAFLYGSYVSLGASLSMWDNCYMCHTSATPAYPLAQRYPASHTDAGFPYAETWPGRAVFDGSAHARPTVVWPGSGLPGGDCRNCHVSHMSPAGTLEFLRSVFRSPKTLPVATSYEAYTLCYDQCHDADGPGPDVASHYKSGEDVAGHRLDWNSNVVTDTSGAYLPQGAQMPCYECHNPHGSAMGSVLLFTDERSPSASVSNRREFCVKCHRASDESVLATPTVAGLRIQKIPGTVPEHTKANSADCGSCHGSGHSATGCGCHPATPSTMNTGSHAAHLSEARGPNGDGGSSLTCDSCHGAGAKTATHAGHRNAQVEFSDAATLGATAVCNPCHSPGGRYNGVDSASGSVGARTNWASGVYAGGDLLVGRERWCLGCHDDAPAVINGRTAPRKTGDETTYGFFITGHGRESAFPKMSWQESGAGGNPAAGRECTDCHEIGDVHIAASDDDRLQSGMANDASNANCTSCHAPGVVAVGAPAWYTDYAAYSNSAHSGTKCTGCHDVHGATGAFAAMTKASKQTLCYTCHTEGGVMNNAVSGASLADDIQQAFGFGSKHDLGTAYSRSGQSYTLECVTCHNVHVVTGKYWDAASNKTPITRVTANTEPWGDSATEKMSQYVGSGTYRTPSSDTFSGSQLPDYATFCLDCHGTSGMPSPPAGDGGINWGGDPHGANSANIPNGGGAIPNWYTAGKAYGWDGDDRIGSDEQCWPVLPRGRGEQIWTREPYTQLERIGGANFNLSCTDCHEAHGSGVRSMIRSNPNGGSGTTIWNTMCNNCHYYYSDWHAGMSCGSASCHVSSRMTNTGTDSLHQMSANTGAGGTRSFDSSMVASFQFSSNIRDSGDWRMHGVWRTTAGSYVAGKSGNGIQISDQPFEIGTENSYWSTDEGYHGTWKYTEMRDTMTLEAWVYPTSLKDENIIMAKHTYWDGGYAFLLKQVDGTLRAALQTNVTGGGPTWPGWDNADCNGLRGAFSSVSVPLNQWTHVAVTYDRTGPDRSASDRSVGRIRIWVDGNDVTWSNPATSGECYTQPGPGETTMFPYSLHSPTNETICYSGHWCASALSIGGVNWSSGSNFVGRLDEAKIWNTPKADPYFKPIDAQVAPAIRKVLGSGSTLVVDFSEGVYSDAGATQPLVAGDFVYTDTGGNNPRTITGVTHTAGSIVATLTLSAPVTVADFDSDTLRFAASQVFDDEGTVGGTATVLVTRDVCPSGKVRILFSEPAGSATATDEQGILAGVVNDPAQTLLGDGYLTGDGINNYIDFESNLACLIADRQMSLEYRIKPTGIPNDTTTSYIRRVLARDGGANFQSSVWRNNPSWPEYQAPAGVASIAYWVRPVDAHGGNAWKVALTDYRTHPIVSNHWYRVKMVWDSDKVGGIPATIYVDDQGTDGAGAGQLWAGFADATNVSQDLVQAPSRMFEGDVITTGQSAFTVGANVSNHANNVFEGQMDWITWDPVADYTLASEQTILPAMIEAPRSVIETLTPFSGAEGSSGATKAQSTTSGTQTSTGSIGSGQPLPSRSPSLPKLSLGALSLVGGVSLLRRALALLRRIAFRV